MGGMITSTNRWLDETTEDHFHKNAYTGGVDFTQYYKDKSWMINVNAAFSQVSGNEEAILRTQESSARYFQREDNDYVNYDPTKTSMSGSGGRLQVLNQKGHWTHLGVLLWKTPGLELNDIGYLRQADQVFAMYWGQYRVWEPKGIYRSWNLSGDYYNIWDFGGDLLGHGLELNGNMSFKNFWNFWGHLNLNTNGLSNTMLRGGPQMRTQGSKSIQYNISTDSRKKLHFWIYNHFGNGFEDSSNSFTVSSGFTYKPINTLSVSVNADYNKSFDELQYVSQDSYNNEDRFIFASLDQKVLSASIRISYNFTPDLTLQYWGQPFIASGKYQDFKMINDPMNETYRNRFDVFSSAQMNLEDEVYNFDENNDGIVDYSIDKPDFNFQEFLSNLVIRWEYNPGSSVYLVWNQTRSGYTADGNLNVGDDLDNLFADKAYNIFLIKLSYRIGL